MPKRTIPFIESAFPLASVPTESRPFTYAVTVPLSKVLVGDLDVKDFETGADAVELVIDASPKSPETAASDIFQCISRAVGLIRRKSVVPIVYHVPWVEDASDEAVESYLQKLRQGVSLAVEYVTVDLRLEQQLLTKFTKTKMCSKIIGTVHLETPLAEPWSSSIWLSYYRKARDLPCDMVRMTRPASDIEDNFEVSKLRSVIDTLRAPRLPLIAYNTGPKGRHSACLNPILSSVLPEGRSLDTRQQMLADIPLTPLLTAQQATRVLHSSFIIDALKLYIFGSKPSYTLSPLMYNTAIDACGLPHHYESHPINSIDDIREVLYDPLFCGASIGSPFKVQAVGLAQTLSSHAKAIGAINTLIPIRGYEDGNAKSPEKPHFFTFRNRSGPVLGLYGENTDWMGIGACIRKGLSPANAVLPSSCSLVVGAGGVARAAVYSMLQLGVKNVVIFNRTPSRARDIAAYFSNLLAQNEVPLLQVDSEAEIKFHVLASRDDPWPPKLQPPTIIISCIPSINESDSCEPAFVLPNNWLSSPTGGVVVQYGYDKLHTPLLEQVRAQAHHGWIAMDGLDLLPEQGFAQFELFTGRRAPRRLMRAQVLKSYYGNEGESFASQLQQRLDSIDREP